MPKQLRTYQLAAIKAFWNWAHNMKGHQFIGAAVNAGKSLIIAEIIGQTITKWPHARIVVLIDEQNLLVQNMAELREQYPNIKAGFYCAGLGQKRLADSVTFASIQSIYAKALLLNKPPNLIIIDEGHGVSEKDGTQFRRFVSDCKALNSRVHVVGLSGSKYRSDSGLVYGGKKSLYAGMSYEIGVKFMIDEGYSVRPVMPKTSFVVDTSDLKYNSQDYLEKELQRVFDKQDVTEKAVAEIVAIGRAENRLQWLIYTAGVEHCEHVAAEFEKHGVSTKAVHSKIKEDANQIFESYKRGEFQCMVVIGKAVKGFSHNGVELIAYLTKTRSPVKYEQTIGRGMRTNYAEGMPLDTKEQRLEAIAQSRKPNFTLLDYGEVVKELGPVDDIQVTKRSAPAEKPKPKDDKKPQMRVCPACAEYNEMTAKHCVHCNHQLVADIVTLADEADKKSALLSSDIEPEMLSVIDWTLSRHVKKEKKDDPNAIPVLKVAYHTYAGNIYEWVCFSHPRGGFAHNRAKAWHDRHMPDYKGCYPENVEDALFLHKENAVPYKRPDKIVAKKNGKYYEFLRAFFDKSEDKVAELTESIQLSESEIDLLY